ncbi:hypothetical protein ACROYT_G038300 [Oculina patagonica]
MKIMTFQKPKGGGIVLVGELRRLSTLSYMYATRPSDLVFTNWKWHWKDDVNVWHLYDKDLLKRDLQKLIEQAFLDSCDKRKPRATFTFATPENMYNLVFCSTRVMYAMNLKTKAKRQVKRRPEKPISNEELDDVKWILGCLVKRETMESTPTSCIPSHWSPLSPNAQYTRVTLDKSSPEIKDVEQLFRKTMNHEAVIESIERVQNPLLWAKYCRNKETMMAAAPLNQKQINEKKLFHGTSPGRVAAICKNNFDPGLDRKNVMFGEGATFAPNASYSHRHATRDDHLSQFTFLAKVLVGSYTVGHPSYRRPPPKQPLNPESDLHDSCVDNNSNPTIFVVFDVNHFYPEYIIKYYSFEYHTTSASYNACNLPSAPVLPLRSLLDLSPSSLHAVTAYNPVRPAVRKSDYLSAAAASTPSGIAVQSSYSTSTVSNSRITSANPTESSSNLGAASKPSVLVLEEQNVLQKKKCLVDSCETKNDHLATEVSSTNEKETPAPAILSSLPTNDDRNDSVKEGVMDSDEKKSTDLKESDRFTASQDPVKVECQRKLPASSSCSSPPDPQKCTPSKKAVFDCILKEFNGTVSFAAISNRQDLFPSGCKDIAEWFKASKESFLLSERKDGKVMEVSVFCPRAQLCSTQACTREDCQYLHVCWDYIAGFCRFGDRCQMNHSFQYDEDRKFLSKLIMLNGLTAEDLRKVIQLSLPQVCLDYNEGSCTKGQNCSKIHICKDMIKKKCESEEDCDLDHESAMTTDHNRRVLERYHMAHLKSDVVKRMILVYDDSDKGCHVHQDKPDALICSEFLLGNLCKKGVKCSEHHCSLPYHWQYRLKAPKVDEWKSFCEKDNETLEELYCDVMLEDKGFLPLDVNFLLDDKVMIIQDEVDDDMANIRRLSTESYANNPSNPVATAWTWYWKDEDGMWLQYGVDHLGRDLQNSIEEAFLNKRNCFEFRISDQEYKLFFAGPATEMHQKNLKYGTTKKARRRPATFKSEANIRKLKRSLARMSSAQLKADKNATSANVPSYWTSMPSDKQYQRVSLSSTSSEYKEVETLFKKTMNKPVVINSIERVQNPFMWEKYQRKKENMQLAVYKRTLNVNEKRLFHGTSPETVEAICKQNFDWRMHGKNKTAYGEGSYFAVNASYSDSYATRNVDYFQFMFLAKVLVGSFTRGRVGYRRPPPKQPSNPASDLYDSCVDNINNPTIFVVFDTDQFYPEYIIKYSHSEASRPVPNPSSSQTAVSYTKAQAILSTAVTSSSRAAGALSSRPGTSYSYSSGLNAVGLSANKAATGSNSQKSSGHNPPSAPNTSRLPNRTRLQRARSTLSLKKKRKCSVM